MTYDTLEYCAYELCLQTRRYEVIADLSYMNFFELIGLISYLLSLQG